MSSDFLGYRISTMTVLNAWMFPR